MSNKGSQLLGCRMLDGEERAEIRVQSCWFYAAQCISTCVTTFNFHKVKLTWRSENQGVSYVTNLLNKVLLRNMRDF